MKKKAKMWLVRSRNHMPLPPSLIDVTARVDGVHWFTAKLLECLSRSIRLDKDAENVLGLFEIRDRR